MIAGAILVLLFTLTIAACPMGRHRAAVESAVIFGAMVSVASMTLQITPPWLFYFIQWSIACAWAVRMLALDAAGPARAVTAVAVMHLIMFVDQLLAGDLAGGLYAAHNVMAQAAYLCVILAIVWDARHGDRRVPRRRWNDYGHNKTHQAGG